MKTKTIDVWVSNIVYDRQPSKTLRSIGFEYSINRPIKAKLLLPIPEKKITITESEFDKAWAKVPHLQTGAITSLKNILGFGDKND